MGPEGMPSAKQVTGRPAECPCYKCETRRFGCHGSCEPYLSWVAVRREATEALKKESDLAASLRETYRKGRRKPR